MHRRGLAVGMNVPCVLGSARITGQYVQFVPASDLVSVPAGEELELGVRFDYIEASHGRESCDIAFEIHHPEEGAKTVTLRVDDRPLLRDERIGVLVHKARFSRAGDFRVRFAVSVGTAHGSWLGGERAAGAAKHEGEVLVRVV